MALKLYEILLDYKLLNHVSPTLQKIITDLEKADKAAKKFQTTLEKINAAAAQSSGLNSAAANYSRAGSTMRSAAADMEAAARSFGGMSLSLGDGATRVERASQALARNASAIRNAGRDLGAARSALSAGGRGFDIDATANWSKIDQRLVTDQRANAGIGRRGGGLMLPVPYAANGPAVPGSSSGSLLLPPGGGPGIPFSGGGAGRGGGGSVPTYGPSTGFWGPNARAWGAAGLAAGRRFLGHGAARFAGGFGAFELGKHAFEGAKSYEASVARLKAIGLPEADVSDATKFANAQRLPGVTSTLMLNTIRDLHSVLNNYPESKELAPFFASLGVANKTLGAEHGGGMTFDERQLKAMEKLIELRGGFKSADSFKLEAEYMQRSYTASGGMIMPTEFLNMLKTGGSPIRRMPAEALYGQLGAMAQEMTGNRVGTGYMSAYQNLIQGKATNAAQEEMIRLGLIDTSHITKKRFGGYTFGLGAVPLEHEFLTDPIGFVRDVRGLMAQRGIVTPDAREHEWYKIYSNRMAAGLFSAIDQQLDMIDKHMSVWRNSPGAQGLIATAQGTLGGAAATAGAGSTDLMTQLGEGISPALASSLREVGSAFKELSSTLASNPDLTRALVSPITALIQALGDGASALASLAKSADQSSSTLRSIGLLPHNGGEQPGVLEEVGSALDWLNGAAQRAGRATHDFLFPSAHADELPGGFGVPGMAIRFAPGGGGDAATETGTLGAGGTVGGAPGMSIRFAPSGSAEGATDAGSPSGAVGAVGGSDAEAVGARIGQAILDRVNGVLTSLQVSLTGPVSLGGTVHLDAGSFGSAIGHMIAQGLAHATGGAGGASSIGTRPNWTGGITAPPPT